MDIQQVLQQVKSPDGQKLMQLLTGSDGGNALHQATAAADSGSTAQMVGMLKKVMQSPEGAALVDRLGSQLRN